MQKSGFIEVIPLICISAIWDQYPHFSHFPPLPTVSIEELERRMGVGGSVKNVDTGPRSLRCISKE